ncbi:MAG: dihydrolipoamide acetyltransferase component of pyruvate dehydrogenase complex [Betaproteobacteria bacterium]|nr:MAG: dihydrolipoamide acetyltransferase component of pyruvate dehydrogenase complex [Betaproteobacteria bacterium]
MIEFKLPSLGADMDEGKLLEWKVSPGDTVKKGQVVAIVDTSKAAVDVESWNEGTVFELLVAPGETIPVGTVMATLLEAGESAETAKRTPRPAPKAAVAPVAAPAPAPRPIAAIAGRRRISPAARKHAEELGVDIETIPGTGPDGAVTLADVEQAAAVKVSPAKTAAAPDKAAEMRRAIAAAMSRSKREIPHYYLSEPVPMRRATEWLAKANEGRPITSRLLMAVLQLKAVALALRKFPEMNGFFRDGAFQPAASAHIGVAISLRQGGLIAPAIHDVGEKTLEQLMLDLTDLVKRARAGSLRSSEMSDPTITVTNLGEQGVAAVYGVIYPPQVALVGFGRIVEQPWAENGALSVMPVVTASLAADHRVSDGHRGALFLAALRDLLQQPENL